MPSLPPAIDNLPRLPLAKLPTPLDEMPNLSKALGGPRLLVKRDDLTGLATGGNKTRKLEFLLADALAQGCDSVITAGGPQSNHCRQTAAAAAIAGLKCHLILGGQPQPPLGNLLLDQLLGATVHWTPKPERNARLATLADELRAAGRRPYVIPVGGSTGLGAVGYVVAMFELVEQLAERGRTRRPPPLRHQLRRHPSRHRPRRPPRRLPRPDHRHQHRPGPRRPVRRKIPRRRLPNRQRRRNPPGRRRRAHRRRLPHQLQLPRRRLRHRRQPRARSDPTPRPHRRPPRRPRLHRPSRRRNDRPHPPPNLRGQRNHPPLAHRRRIRPPRLRRGPDVAAPTPQPATQAVCHSVLSVAEGRFS